jgi:hypothetical protein
LRSDRMNTTRVDDRTADQKQTHTFLVTATDKFMSGWGMAKGGASKVAWACKPEHYEAVLRWVSSRKEMRYVSATTKTWRPRAAHVHIYVVGDNHPAIV